MGLFQRLKKSIQRFSNNLALYNDKAWNPALWNLAGNQSQAGVNVTEQTALTYAAVYNAVSLISGTIAALPLHLYRRKANSKAIADDHSLYRVLHDAPNPYMTAMLFRETSMAHVLTWGNAYAEKVFNGYGEVIQLWPITPNRVRMEMKNGELVYNIKVDRSEMPLPREKVLHIPGLGYDGFQGYSVISIMARNSIGLGMALEKYGSLFFQNGYHPGIVVSHPGTLKDPAKLRDALSATYSGLGNSHRLMLLEEAMKVEKLSIPNNDSQFLESRIFQIQEVARWFNVPVHKLKEMSKSSFNNIEQEQRSFYADTILPWLVRLEQNYNMQLFTASEQRLNRLYFKHNVKGLLRGDTASQTAFYTALLDRGVFSINDVRELEDMDPISGGDIHLVPLNMTTLENAGKTPDPAVKALPAPGKEPGKGGSNE